MKADLTLVASYSEALFETARKAGVLDLIAEQASIANERLEINAKFRAFIEAPNIPREAKDQLIVRLAEANYHPIMVNYTRLLIRRGRVELLSPSLKAFHRLYQKHLGITPAKVTTAVPLSPEDMARLEAALNKHTGKRLVIRWKVDEKVIGGIRFKSGDLLVDSTIARKLDRLKHELLHVKVY